jgi:hypothetical protein
MKENITEKLQNSAVFFAINWETKVLHAKFITSAEQVNDQQHLSLDFAHTTIEDQEQAYMAWEEKHLSENTVQKKNCWQSPMI